MLTTDEEIVMNQIDDWLMSLQSKDQNKFNAIFQRNYRRLIKIIPSNYKEDLLNITSSAFFYSQVLLQSSKNFLNKKQEIIQRARFFNKNIAMIKDLQQLSLTELDFLVQQEISKMKVYSTFQGGLTGTGNLSTLIADLPTLFLLNFNCVQVIAMHYGFDVSIPLEMETALKVFQASLLPFSCQYSSFKLLNEELSMKNEDQLFYDREYTILNEDFYQTIILHLFKLAIIAYLRNKSSKKISFLGIIVGAKWNDSTTNHILQYTQRFYQYRLLLKKEKGS